MRARESITLKVQGLTLEGVVWRAPGANAPRILALHGWLDNIESFTPLAQYLSAYHVVAVDLPGHGHSAHRSADSSYHFIDWVATLVGILDALQWNNAILMGHSMGAGASMLTAATLPERIQALILIDALAPYTAKDDVMPERLRSHLNEARRRQGRAMRPYKTVDQAVQSLCKVVPLLSHAHATLIVGRNTRPVEGGFVWRGDPRLRGTSVMTLTEAQLHAFLARVLAPALFIRAPDGLAWDETELTEHANAMQRLETIYIDGGHHVHMEQARRVAEAIIPWLNQRLAGAAPVVDPKGD